MTQEQIEVPKILLMFDQRFDRKPKEVNDSLSTPFNRYKSDSRISWNTEEKSPSLSDNNWNITIDKCMQLMLK